MADFFWFSDAQWARIEPLLPTGLRGKRRVDDRRVLSGIVHALQSGGRWGDCPPVYGPRKTLYNPVLSLPKGASCAGPSAASGRTSSARWLGPRTSRTGCSSTALASRSTAPQAAQKGGLGQWYRPDTRGPQHQAPCHLRRKGQALRLAANPRKCARYAGRQAVHRGHAAVRRTGR